VSLLPGRFLLLLALALEVVATVLVAERIGVPATLAWFAVSFVAGLVVIKRAGTRAWNTLRGAARQPGEPVGDTPLLFAAGLLLILPGVLSDLGALILLFPPGRAVVKAWLVRMVSRRVTVVRGAVSRVRIQSDGTFRTDLRAEPQAGELVEDDEPGPPRDANPGGRSELP
jgi:UPF0716 protein FxsA